LILIDQPSVDVDEGSAARLPWGAKKSGRIRQILPLFIADIPGRLSIDHDAINHT
jgi:hypothetical protein